MNLSNSLDNALNRPILDLDKPYLVVDILDNNKVIKQYKKLSTAHKTKNRLDNDFGAYRYSVRSVQTIQQWS
tara:strand:- start:404 stop:619 length:216 start_codon:yes stop_codon:yes gene_type:complete